MAHFWLQNESAEWVSHPITGPDLKLGPFLVEALGVMPAADGIPSNMQLLKVNGDNRENWIVVAGHTPDISINGLPLLLGIYMLRDRDEIRWSPDGFAFFSSEEPASVVNLPHSDIKIFCPRCKQEIVPGTPAVHCPGCGIWHHQSEQLPCYTYSETCATCTRKTSLDGGYEWTPEAM